MEHELWNKLTLYFPQRQYCSSDTINAIACLIKEKYGQCTIQKANAYWTEDNGTVPVDKFYLLVVHYSNQNTALPALQALEKYCRKMGQATMTFEKNNTLFTRKLKTPKRISSNA